LVLKVFSVGLAVLFLPTAILTTTESFSTLTTLPFSGFAFFLALPAASAELVRRSATASTARLRSQFMRSPFECYSVSHYRAGSCSLRHPAGLGFIWLIQPDRSSKVPSRR